MDFNPLEHPIIFANPLRLTTSSWVQHLPFGMFLIDLLRPKILVELGTHYGVSYCGFCQAVKELHTDTACYAVDNWLGDEHTGAYGAEVFEDLRHHHDLRYGDFSRLLKMNFDDAQLYFADHSIDLLHIDGYHTYEAVRHDFERWLPKLSDRAVVLLHDINEREREFGVWRYWDELKTQYPSFEMLHEHGLGILAVGNQIPDSLNLLLQTTDAERTQIREFFFLLGMRITLQIEAAEFASRYQHVQNLEALVVERDAEIHSAKEYIDSLVKALEDKAGTASSHEADFNAQQAQLQHTIEQERYQREQAEAENRQLGEEIAQLQALLKQQSDVSSQTAILTQTQALQDHITALELEFANKVETARTAVTYAASLEQSRTDKENELRTLQELHAQSQRELAYIHHSLTYRAVVRPIWKVRRILLPDGSRRAKTYFGLRRRVRSALRPEVVSVAPTPAPTPIVKAAIPAKFPYAILPPLAIPAGSTVVCTIISKNYLAAARTLMKSVRNLHPELQLVTLLVDEIDGYFDPQQEIFQTFLAADLGIAQWKHFSMKYDIMELNTAVKPYLLEMLMSRYQAQKVIYFDPDIVVYHDLNRLLTLLDQHTAILTPHILDPIHDSFQPGEIDFLRVGTFNLGFFALSRQGQWRDVLAWWQEKLYAYCTREVERGLFVDQHWMDLLPSLFDGIYVLREPAYNSAYWNIQNRDLQRDTQGRYTINQQPLVFFHFSGFSVDRPELISKHQNRFTLSQLNGSYNACFMEYRSLLLENGYVETKTFPYEYNRFADGVPITDILRMCLRKYDLFAETWNNPYDIQSADNFRNWVTHPQALASLSYLSPYAVMYYSLRPDLYRTFPDPLGADERRYAEWFVQQTDPVDVFHAFYLNPMRAALRGEVSPLRHPSPLKKKALTDRLRQTVRYYQDYPDKVKPLLPPDVLAFRSEIYNGPMNAYGTIRYLLKQIGILQFSRRLIGLRLILTARFFFSEPNQKNPLAELATKKEELLPPPLLTSPIENQTTSAPDLDPALSEGVNVIGYLRSETGIAEAARRVLRGLQAVEFPAAAYVIEVHDTSRKQDSTIEAFVQRLPHKVNLFHINADMTLETYKHLGLSAYRNRYNIGYWFWETSVFPQQWRAHSNLYSEIWVGTRFVQEAVAQSVSCPVIHMPGSIEVALPEVSSRVLLGLPADAFLVLFIFDALSVIERKNPWAVIRAFEQAFSSAERDHDVRLIMKVTNLERFPQEQKRLQSEIRRVNGVLLDSYMSRLEVNALINHCDVYISLHRSEGFGLTLAEAMYLGKPSIATAYSGNMDFMTAENSSLVPYRLVELTRAYPPYELGNVWAEPDEEAAAQILREVYTHRDEAAEKARYAREDIRNQFSPKAAGERIAKRLRQILDEMTAPV